MKRVEREMQDARQAYEREVGTIRKQKAAFRKEMKAKFAQCKLQQELNGLRAHIVAVGKTRSERLRAITAAQKRKMQELQSELTRLNTLYGNLVLDDFDAEVHQARAKEAIDIRKSGVMRKSLLSGAVRLVDEATMPGRGVAAGGGAVVESKNGVEGVPGGGLAPGGSGGRWSAGGGGGGGVQGSGESQTRAMGLKAGTAQPVLMLQRGVAQVPGLAQQGARVPLSSQAQASALVWQGPSLVPVQAESVRVPAANTQTQTGRGIV